MKISTKDIIYTISIIALAVYFTSSSNKDAIKDIEARLTETCFMYAQDCDDDKGECTCELKASGYQIDYIMDR